MNVNDLCTRGIGERHDDDAHSPRWLPSAWLACLSLRALLASTQHPPPVKLQIVAAMPHTLPSRAGLTSADVEGFALRWRAAGSEWKGSQRTELSAALLARTFCER